MNRTVSIVIVVIAILGGGWFLWSTSATDDISAPTTPGSTPSSSGRAEVAVPDLTLTDYNGTDVALHSLVGTPLIINAWATWCPFCVKELPDFATVQAEFGDQVSFVAIDRAESLAKARAFTDELGISDAYLFLVDPGDSFYEAIGGFSMPETLFVTADGTVHFHKRGPMSVEEIRERTQALIEASAS